MSDRIHADYWIETAFEVEAAVEVMAGEQSSGTFVKLPGETPELKDRYGARVEHVGELDAVGTPSLPGAGAPEGIASPEWRRARVQISWPIENMGPSLPNLAATIAGNLFELKQFSGLRLLDVRLPGAFRDTYQRPAVRGDGHAKAGRH